MFKPDELAGKIRVGMACTPEEFVQSTLSAIIDLTSSSSDFNNFASILHKDLPGSAMIFPMLFTQNDKHICCHLLAAEIEHLIDLTCPWTLIVDISW